MNCVVMLCVYSVVVSCVFTSVVRELCCDVVCLQV